MSQGAKGFLSPEIHLTKATLIVKQVWKVLGLHMISHICDGSVVIQCGNFIAWSGIILRREESKLQKSSCPWGDGGSIDVPILRRDLPVTQQCSCTLCCCDRIHLLISPSPDPSGQGSD